jgi:hypothetical protein
MRSRSLVRCVLFAVVASLVLASPAVGAMRRVATTAVPAGPVSAPAGPSSSPPSTPGAPASTPVVTPPSSSGGAAPATPVVDTTGNNNSNNGNGGNGGPGNLGNNNNNSPQFNGNATGPNAFVSSEGVVEQPGLIEVSASSTVDVHTDRVRVGLMLMSESFCPGCENLQLTDRANSKCNPTALQLSAIRSAISASSRALSDSVAQYCGSSSVRRLMSRGIDVYPIHDHGCDWSKAIGVEDGWSNWCRSNTTRIIGYRAVEMITFEAPVGQAGAVIAGAIERGATVLAVKHVASEGALVLGELRATQRATIEAALEVRTIAQLIAKLNQKANMQFHDEDEHWNYMHDRRESGDMERDYNDDGFGKSPFDKDRFQQCVSQKMNDYQNGGNNNNNYNSFSTSPATPVSAAGNNNNNGGNSGNSNNLNGGTCSGLQITLRSILCNPLDDAGQLGVFEGIAAVAATNLGSQQDGQKNQQDDHAWASSQSYQSYASPVVVPVTVKCILIVDIQNAEQQAQSNKHGSGGPN